MAKSPVFKISVFFGVLALIAAGAVTLSVLSSYKELCEVCVTFRGRTECKQAYGKTKDDAIQTAHDNACGVLAGGMTDTVSCGNTQPDRAVCQQ